MTYLGFPPPTYDVMDEVYNFSTNLVKKKKNQLIQRD